MEDNLNFDFIDAESIDVFLDYDTELKQTVVTLQINNEARTLKFALTEGKFQYIDDEINKALGGHTRGELEDVVSSLQTKLFNRTLDYQRLKSAYEELKGR